MAELPALLNGQFQYVVFERAGLPASVVGQLAAAGYSPIYSNERAEILVLDRPSV